jgi:FkbM family methyltransferase
MNVFIDGGANVGQSIRMFREFYPKANEYQVIAIEPFPSNFSKLKALYGRDSSVTLIEGALSNREGRAEFFTGNPLSGSLRVDKQTGGVNPNLSIDVVCIDIEKLLLGLHGHRVVLKLDVEGAEYDLIEHMHKTKSLGLVHELFGEWHFGKLADLTESAHIGALGQLSDYGLRMKEWEAENEYMEGFVDRRAYWKARKSSGRCLNMIQNVISKSLGVLSRGS